MLSLRRLFILLIAATGIGCAQTDAMHDENCNRLTDLQCATNALAVAEKYLGEIYQRVADTEEDEGVKRLGISQRHWIKYRDSYIEFTVAHAPDSKTLELRSINQRIDMTIARSKELQHKIQQE